MAVDDSARPSAGHQRQRQSAPASQATPHQQRGEPSTCTLPQPKMGRRRPTGARLQLQPDQEQHQHHAELGKVQHVLHIGHQPQAPGPDGDARAQVADDGTQAQRRASGTASTAAPR
jgi:hypothetical protein